jgi:7-keto-8-aminopelargonate synthetase-like enzyme
VVQTDESNSGAASGRAPKEESRPDFLDYSYDMFLASSGTHYGEADGFSKWMDDVTEADLYAFEAERAHAQYPEMHAVRTSGMPLTLLNLSSYNYLGFGYHPEVIQAAKDALDRYGLGAANSPAQAGTMSIHRELEKRLVDFMGLPNRGVSLFPAGYTVNVGTVSALLKRRHHLVMDQMAHMSMVEGAQLSGCQVHIFEHNNPADLERILKEEIASKEKRVLIATEGVFSADGDFGRLKEIVAIAKAYNASVLVDEAHSFLVAGPNGRGVAEAQGVLEDIDLFVITFSKALGGMGGALIARKEIIRYVNWYARCRLFSCALDPAVTAGVAKGVELGGGEVGRVRRERIIANARHLRSRLSPHVPLGRTESWIVPVIYGDEGITIKLADYLQRHGMEGSCMEFPAVPSGEARLRLFVTSEHSIEQLDRAADLVIQAANQFDFALTSPK